ncbi:hypothetical protein AAVH_27613 [Aphelenchoides avenae]|nr:hypothetical protein AAVH_27613 [Aphelenchus avenae]
MDHGTTNSTEAWNKWAKILMKETCEPGFHERVKAELLKKKNLTDDCRTFILDCLRAEPKQRPSASELLEYPFIAKRQSAPWKRRVAQWLNGRKNK